jgi:ELWxxDGT repeat protein
MSGPPSDRSLRRVFVALALLVGAAAPPVHAGAEYMVQDLAQLPLGDYVDTVPPIHAELDGFAYFYRSDGIHGRELWRSDGTPGGTALVLDICPGICGSEAFSGWNALATVGSQVFFSGNDGVHGSELWVTDGTPGGTHLVADIQAGPRSSEPDTFVALGGLLFFLADDGVHGRELWRSDGTEAGTWMVVDLTPGPDGSGIWTLAAGGGQLYIDRLQDELWVSDGTAAGTEVLATGLGLPQQSWAKGAAFRTLPDGVLVFSGCSEPNHNDCEPWRSDGTVAGTYRLADLMPGTSGSTPDGFFVVGDEIWFSAYDDFGSGPALYRTDGTVAGTAPIPLPAGTRASLRYGSAEVVGSRLFFTGCTTSEGCEPWVTDGTTSSMLADLDPGPDGSIPQDLDFTKTLFADAGGTCLFLADDGVHGLELWASDGTPSGTVAISDLGSPPAGSYFSVYQSLVPPMLAGSRALLIRFRPDVGVELWSSDASAAGTAPIATIDDQTSSFFNAVDSFFGYHEIRCLAPLGRGMVFAALDDPSSFSGSLYFTDGVPGELDELTPIFDQTSALPECASNGDEVLTVGGLLPDAGLWRTRASDAATEFLLQLDPNGWPLTYPLFQRFDGAQFFGWGAALFRVDPGVDPAQIPQWPSTILSGGMAATQDELFLGGSDGLEVTDGRSPPEPLIPVPPQPDYASADDLTPSGSRLFFSLDTPAEGPELWSSNGTPEGTGPVTILRPGPLGAFLRRETREAAGGNPPESRIASLGGGRIVFAADDGFSGNELWTSDGTAAGTVLVTDLVPGPEGSWPRHLRSLGGGGVFAADDGVHGLELWRTDGTAAGTGLLLDIVPGPDSSVPQDLTVQDGVLYFSAWTPDAGREAWRSDGTAAGTFRITDAAPGPLSSSPSRFIRVGDRLFFVADDNVHGFELWALADNGGVALFLDGFETGDASRWSAAAP